MGRDDQMCPVLPIQKPCWDALFLVVKPFELQKKKESENFALFVNAE